MMCIDGQIEADMVQHDPIQIQDAFLQKLYNIIAENPLLGNACLPDDDVSELMARARRSIERFMNTGQHERRGDIVIVLALIQIAKTWKDSEEDTGRLWDYVFELTTESARVRNRWDTGRLWDYVFEQLGYRRSQKLYAEFQRIIECVLKKHSRLFLENTSGRDFYSTILLHAIAPHKSVFAFFDFLFEFYKKNLNWTYDENDYAIERMVSVLHERIDSNRAPEHEGLYSSFYGMQAGIKSLIKTRPKYTTCLAKSIISRFEQHIMDNVANPENRIEELIAEWYQGKYREINSSRTGTRKRRETYTANTYSAIRIRYELSGAEKDEVVLVIPEIRLHESEIEYARAIIQINGEEYRKDLHIFGDELSQSIASEDIKLSSYVSLGSIAGINIRIKIICESKEIHDTNEQLFREFIVFKGSREISPNSMTPNAIYTLYCPSAQITAYNCDYDSYGLHDCFCSLATKSGCAVFRNNAIIFSDSNNEQVGFQLSAEPIDHVICMADGKQYQVLADETECRIYVPAGEKAKQFMLIVNGEKQNLAGLHQIASDEGQSYDGTVYRYIMHCEECSKRHYRIQLYDIDTEKVIYGRQYCLIHGFSIKFSKPFFLCHAFSGNAYLTWMDGRQEMITLTNPGDNSVLLEDSIELIVSPPTVQFDVPGETPILIGSEKPIWLGNIPNDFILEATQLEGVRIDVVASFRQLLTGSPLPPPSASVRIDVVASFRQSDKTVTLPKKSGGNSYRFDIGNFIHNISATSLGGKKVSFTAEIATNDYTETCYLFCVCVAETYWHKPQFLLEDRRLEILNPQDYIGEPDSLLTYSFSYGSDIFSCSASVGENVLSTDCRLQDGIYTCEVTKPQRGFFSTGPIEIFRGRCGVGNREALRILGKVLQIKQAVVENQCIDISPVYIRNLRYLGEESNPLYAMKYACYRGECYCLNEHNDKVYFWGGKYGGSDKQKYQLNPVRIKVINNELLEITTSDGDGLYMKKHGYKITDDKPAHSRRFLYVIADCYVYQIEEE
jgi:hypothetical protein